MIVNRFSNYFNLSVRMYHRGRGRPSRRQNYAINANSGITEKMKLLQEIDEFNESDEMDAAQADDYNEYESDFMDVHKTYKVYQWEKYKAKENLKMAITKKKFLTEKQPCFLTFTERMEIKKLHGKDPEYWTAERLSESFPALPETIRQVIKQRWSPTVVNVVEHYDQNVIENWEKFRTEELAINPLLKKHLERFKDRIVKPADKEYIKTHILEPKIQFPEPKNYFFRKLFNNYSDDKSPQDNNLLNSGEKTEIKEGKDVEKVTSSTDPKILQKQNKNDNDKKESFKLKNIINNTNLDTKPQYETPINVKKQSFVSQLKHLREEPQTCSEFIKNNVEFNTVNTPETTVMKQMYETSLLKTKRAELERRIEKVDTNEKLNSEIISSAEQEKSCTTPNTKEDKVLNVDNTNDPQNKHLQTYVKAWVKLNENECDYPQAIRIPKGRYVKGMTYRVKDCYYDDDGKFLYRVPGLRN